MVNENWAKGEEYSLKAIRLMKQLDDYEPLKVTMPLVNLGFAYW
jgi:hypothetical protein